MTPEKFYMSDKGSRVREFGAHLLSFEIDWDWFEEDACCDSGPHWDGEEKCIIASCDCCLDSPFAVKCREVTKEEFNA